LLTNNWQHLRFGQLTLRESSGDNLFQVEVFLGDLPPEAIRVELYAEPLSRDTNPIRITMESGEMLTGSGVGLYHATVSTARPASDYTPRVIPYHAEASVPLEANFILWHE
jgi:starch phosphorylase